MRLPTTLSSRIEATLVFLAATVLSLAAGYISSTSDVRLIVVALGLLGVVIVLVNPSFAITALMVAALTVVGTLQLYLPGFQMVGWAVAGTTFVMGLYVFVERSLSLDKTPGPVSPILFCALLFIAISLLSSILNNNSLDIVAFGLKGYFQVLGLFFAICLMRWDDIRIKRLPAALIAVGLIQLPFVLHQYFVLVPARANLGGGIVAEDIVSGTMGATMLGGGSNAVLSLLLISAIALIAGIYKNHKLKLTPALVMISLCAVPLLLNSNRAALLYLPLAYLIIFKDDVIKRPLRVIGTGLAMALLVVALVWANATLSSRSDEFDGWQELLSLTIERNSEEQFGWGDYDVNRITVMSHWASEHSRGSDIPQILYGHGPGQSREAQGRNAALGARAQVKTLARTKYPSVGIGLTGVSSLLWEVGILGLAVIAGLFWSAYRAATYLIHRYEDFSYRKGVVEGMRAAVIILGISLFFKNAIVFHLPFQALLFTILGILAFWQRQERAREETEGEHAGNAAKA